MNRSYHAVTALALVLSPVAAADPTHGYLVASDGVKIHYMVEGSGTPVVLIHGYTGSAEGNWFANGVAEALAKNHRVIAIDIRGHGASDKPTDPSSYGVHLWRDVLELMDHLDIDKAHVHGYSMGGSITTQLLIHAPDRFITASYGGSGVREVDPEQLAKVPPDEEGSDPREAEALDTLRASPTREDAALGMVVGSWREAFAGQIDLTQIRIPVLAINGELDSPNAKTHRMERELADFRSVVLPGKSHLTAIMAGYIPDLYITSLVGFIEGHAETVAEASARPARPDRNARSIYDTRVQHRTYELEEAGGEPTPYALFVPTTYVPDQPHPLMVSLHGLGRQYDWLMGYQGMLDYAERDGFIIVTPLGYTRRGWFGSRDMGRTGELSEKDVMRVLALVREEFNIDDSRIYLWGHSMGGAGTYHLAMQFPDIWAGLGVAAPAPSVSPDTLEKIAHLPIIVLQGDQDRLVGSTRRWVAKMKELGMEHVYIEVPGGDHSRFISRSADTLGKLFAFFNIVRKQGR